MLSFCMCLRTQRRKSDLDKPWPSTSADADHKSKMCGGFWPKLFGTADGSSLHMTIFFSAGQTIFEAVCLLLLSLSLSPSHLSLSL